LPGKGVERREKNTFATDFKSTLYSMGCTEEISEDREKKLTRSELRNNKREITPTSILKCGDSLPKI
jgi:hypothetical protein